MGAVALSSVDEAVLGQLQKRLGLPSKSQVIHRALEQLREAVERERLAREVARSVKKCAQADLKEHRALSGGAFYRSGIK